MKKLFVFIFITTIILSPVFFVFKSQKVEAVGSWYYLIYIKNQADPTKNSYPSSEECLTARNTFINSPLFINGYQEDGTGLYPSLPGNCTEESDPVVNVIPQSGTGATDNTYNLLAPIGTFTKAPENIGDYFNTIFLIAIGLCGALAVVMIVIGGIQYMGEESIFGKTEAKKQITSAILGLLIALGSWVLLNTINPDLLGGGVHIAQVSAEISPEDTSTGSSTGLCISNNPPNPDDATGTTITLNSTMTNEYLVQLNTLNTSKGVKLLITAQTVFEGFNSTPAPGTKSYRTKNPGNIGNLDDGTTKSYPTLKEGIQAQGDIVARVANNISKSYKIGSKPTCALGEEEYNGSLYQYLRIYATGARVNNSYLNAIIGYFKTNGKNITARTTITEIYNMN